MGAKSAATPEQLAVGALGSHQHRDQWGHFLPLQGAGQWLALSAGSLDVPTEVPRCGAHPTQCSAVPSTCCSRSFSQARWRYQGPKLGPCVAQPAGCSTGGRGRRVVRMHDFL